MRKRNPRMHAEMARLLATWGRETRTLAEEREKERKIYQGQRWKKKQRGKEMVDGKLTRQKVQEKL